MLRIWCLGIVCLVVLNSVLAEEQSAYGGHHIISDARYDGHHIIPDARPLQFIDSSAVGHYSILDVIKPTSAPMIEIEKPVVKTMTNASCLTLVLADNLKEHITPDNLEPVTVLLQHSLETCPGLKSTFEILQKMMDIKGMSIDEAIDFIQKLTVSQGGEDEIGAAPVAPEAEEEHNIPEVESVSVPEPSVADKPEHVEHFETELSIDQHPSEETSESESPSGPDVQQIETENEETNVEPSDEDEEEEEEEDNTNPLDVIRSAWSMLENDPRLSTLLNKEENDDGEEDEAPIDPEPQHANDNVEVNCNGWGCFKHRTV